MLIIERGAVVETLPLTPLFMKQLTCLVAFCCALFFTGCETASLPVDHDFDPEFQFSSNARFALLPVGSVLGSREIRVIIGDGELPLLAAKAELEERGFVYSSEGSADFLLGVRAEFHPSRLDDIDSLADVPFQGRSNVRREKLSTVVVGGGTQNPDWIPDLDTPSSKRKPKRYTQMDHVRVGTHVSNPSYQLWVDVYDAKTRFLVWQGMVYSDLAASFASDEKRLRAVQTILEEFPN